MTEPAAYMWKTAGGNVLGFQEYKENTPYPGYATPLYTAEQLHPRVKMTQKQFNSFQDYWYILNKLNAIEMLDRYFNFGDFPDNIENLLLPIANIWEKFNPDNPEETIEIVPDMKWFVRSKKRDDEGDFEFISGIETPDAWGYSKNHNGVNDPRACAYAFDTKEEAEKWTNPLTEAVQSPVEGNND